MLKQNEHGNALMKALKKDPLIAPFTRIPAKEGGVDVEGIAACGDRVALGMRGPVVGKHAVLLEMFVSAKKSGKLHLDAPPFKRLLAMEGLGIRDLKRHGDDLLILAGPTTGLSGPVALYRWRDWVHEPPQDATKVRPAPARAHTRPPVRLRGRPSGGPCLVGGQADPGDLRQPRPRPHRRGERRDPRRPVRNPGLTAPIRSGRAGRDSA
jgi:hypothetical protein